MIFEENTLAASYLPILFEYLAPNTEKNPFPVNITVLYIYIQYTSTQTNKYIINEANYAKGYKNYFHMK